MSENYPDERHYDLSNAIDAKNWEEAERLILAGVEEERDYYDYDDYPLIFLLMEAGQEELAILWFDHGYPYWITGGREQATILHWAAKCGMSDLINKSLGLGIDINELTQSGYSALWYAAKYGQSECVKLLLDHGAYVDGEEIDETSDWQPQTDTPLCVAANAEIAKLLLESGASVEIGPCAGSFFWGREFESLCAYDEALSPLTVAAIHGRMDVVRLLADWSVPVDSQTLRFMAFDKYGATLDDAAELVRMGADPNGEPGKEPLRVAARIGNAPFCCFLLDAGAMLVPELLSVAVLSGKDDCVDLFLDHGDMVSSIRTAAKIGVESILEKLLALRPDLATYALPGAISGCRLNIAREMLEKGISPNFRDNDGRTPLMLLYGIDRRKDGFRFMQVDPNRYRGKWQYGRSRWEPSERDFEEKDFFDFNLHRPDNWNELVHLIDEDVLAFAAELIEKGADIHVLDNKGRSALWHACSRSWMKSIPWLTEMGLDINKRDNDGNSSFDAGCLSGESFTIEPMLKAGAVIDGRDGNGDTALLKSAREYQADPRAFSLSVIMTLLRFGADPDLENNAGESLRKMAEKDDNIRFALDMHEKL